MPDLPTVSAIVVTYRTGLRLKDCLYTLRADPEISEIIIVDNGNPDADAAWMDAFARSRETIQLLRDDTNPGFGTGVNKGARAAGGDYLLVINPDAMLRQNSISALLAALTGKSAPAIVGGKIFGIDGQEERGGRRLQLTLPRALGLEKWTLENDPPPDGPVEVGAISGAFFLTSREDFETLGGFDESYFLHFEDLDLCRRAWLAGGSVTYVPGAAALHFGSTSGVTSSFVMTEKIKSLKYYLRKFASDRIEKLLLSMVLPFVGLAMRLRG